MLVIGVDEAGYGPNLGPLVVSATLWRVPEPAEQFDFYAALHRAVAAQDGGDSRVIIADSKQLYKSGGDWRKLERGVGAALRLVNAPADRWRSLWAALDPESYAQRGGDPWHDDFDLALPRDCPGEEIDRALEIWASAMRDAGIQLVAAHARLVFPCEFNRLLDRWGNKSNALSQVTVELVRGALPQRQDEEPVLVWCDKHGGRMRYGALLQHAFPDDWIETRRESREESVYRWGPADGPLQWSFTERGERRLPVALASMLSKYLREISMCSWNAFWRRQAPDLKPTAGYPLDARRFLDEVAAAVQRLGIAQEAIWRRL